MKKEIVVGVQGDGDFRNLSLIWPPGYWPVTVDTGEPWERNWRLSLPCALHLLEVWTFIGLDQRDHAEVDIELYAQNAQLDDAWPIVLRSFHRHGGQDFESWQRSDFSRTPDIRYLRLFLRARRMPDMGKIRAHFGIKLLGYVPWGSR